MQQILLGMGAAKADPVYIDDIFSTYLWKGDGNVKTINNGLKLGSGLNLPLGTYIQGGYYQGTFTDNSVDYALIVAPNGTGNNNGNYKTYGSSSTSSGATSLTNGPSNTATLAAAGGDWPAADWAYALSLNGYSDWYLPAKNELTLLYQNRATLPSGQAWDTSFDTWSSTEINSTYAWMIYMSSGAWSSTDNKTKTRLVRAIRRVTVASLSSYDVTGEGGLVWIKQRNGSNEHVLFDTARGATKAIVTSSFAAETTISDGLTSFLPYGFQIDDNARTGDSTDTYSSFSFRRSEGFFDIVTYSGDGTTTGRAINHGLKSKPGFIIVKRLDSGGSNAYRQWFCYHDALPDTYQIKLSSSDPKQTNGNDVFGTGSSFVRPTSTQFTVGEFINYSGASYVAYLFGGGESDAATARSVGFSSSSTYLSIPDSNDFDFGSTFTFEAWVKPEFHSGGNNLIFEHGSFQIAITDTGRLNFDLNHVHIGGDFHSSTGSVPEGQWTHVAVVGTSGTLKMYINGVNDQNANRTGVDVTGDTGAVTISDSTGYYFKGEISNLRIVKGTAVYTSSFKPPTEPLTNITNTVLLCCNGSSANSSTVTPGTITANGSPTAETDSPFDDPAGFKFGETGDQNVIKCGSYTKTDTGSSNTLHIELGWEPQIILQKRTDGSGDWYLMDVMREMSNNLTEILVPNSNSAETDYGGTIVVPTATGFTVQDNNSDSYIFLAIRRSDGYVSKLPELGTDVFNVVLGNSDGSPVIPVFAANFPVDFALRRRKDAVDDTDASARLTGAKRVKTNTTDNQSGSASAVFDSNLGWNNGDFDDRYVSWMWKRGQGFDCICYKGEGNQSSSPLILNHGLGRSPNLIWIKNRTTNSTNWFVYNSESGENKFLILNSNGAEIGYNGGFSNISATSIGLFDSNTTSGKNFLALLFASVDSISKVGSLTSPSSGNLTVTLGFQPRVIIIKCTDSPGTDWHIFDSARGMVSGDYSSLKLNSSDDEETSSSTSEIYYVQQTSTGFIFNADFWGEPNENFIYYAHA